MLWIHFRRSVSASAWAMPRALASGVKGSDDYRGPRLWGGPLAISTDCPRPAWKTLRTVAARYHKSFSFARFKSCQFKHSKDFKAFKHKTRKNSTEYLRAVCGPHTEGRVSDCVKKQNSILFRSVLLLNEQNTPCQFKHASTKTCEIRLIRHPHTEFCAHTQSAVSHSSWTPNWVLPLLALEWTNTFKIIPKYTSWQLSAMF